MLNIRIPGWKNIQVENIIFDYNGTLAEGGEINEEIKEYLEKVGKILNVYVVTADTYGTVAGKLKGMDVNLKVFPSENAGDFKRDILREVGKEKTICVGNGFNDLKMLEESIIGIAVIGKEGCSAKLMNHADILVNSITDVFEMIFDTERIIATLRN